MKTSVAILAAATGLAMARPEFLNSNFDVVPGEPFTLKFRGCDSGCEIILLNGPPKNLKPVQTLIENTTGSEETITLSEKFNTDKYAFEIKDSDGQVNYSEQFDFQGQDPAPTTSEEETSTAVETTSAEETSTEETTSTSAEETTTVTTTSAEETTTVTTPEASTTETDEATTTSDSDAEATTTGSDSDNQDDAAVRLGASHVTLAAAVVALVGYFL